MSAPELTIVLPMYNEADMVERVLAAVSAQVRELGRSYEIVCVDDGSVDGTLEALQAAAERDEHVVPVIFSRNFGKEAAMLAGLEAARGRAVVVMDADLQHPPDLLPRMVTAWDDGFDVVDAVKEHRGQEGPLYRFAAEAFYALMGRSVGDHLRGSSDFKLLDRQVVDAVLAMPERTRFFRGLVAWVGFSVHRIPFRVQPRAAGATSWNTWGLVRYSLRNLVAFTAFPLRVVALVGFVTVGLDVLLALQTLINWFRGVAVDGFTTVILTVGLLGGLILIALGVVALYLGQVYDELKGRPVYLVRKVRGRSVAATEERLAVDDKAVEHVDLGDHEPLHQELAAELPPAEQPDREDDERG